MNRDFTKSRIKWVLYLNITFFSSKKNFVEKRIKQFLVAMSVYDDETLNLPYFNKISISFTFFLIKGLSVLQILKENCIINTCKSKRKLKKDVIECNMIFLIKKKQYNNTKKS